MRLLLLLLTTMFTFSAHAGDHPVIVAAKAVEARYGGRVGVHVAFADGGTISHRANERFPMMSTFKTLLCAAALKKADMGTLDLSSTVTVQETDIVTYSPVVKKLVGTELSLMDACEATMLTSDNAAANIVLKAIGGPAAVTAFARSLGDTMTRLDRYETALNSAVDGDPRDTTTPKAYSATLEKLLLGGTLSEKARTRLTRWMEENKITGALLRKHLPDGWRIADRAGAGENGSRGFAAMIWPPEGLPFTVVIYMTNSTASFKERNEAVARIGKVILANLLGH